MVQIGNLDSPHFAKGIGNVRQREGLRMSLKNRGQLISISEHVKKIVMNNVETWDEVNLGNYFDYEFLYFRNNEITSFDSPIPFLHVKILDLSCNLLSDLRFLNGMQTLKHLMLSCNNISSLEQIPMLPHLESLSVSQNLIESFKGLQSFPKLKVLNLMNNNIKNYEHYPTLQNLESINLSGNPICKIYKYREITVGIHTSKLEKIDGVEITQQEREEAADFGGKVAQCIRSGVVIPDNTSTKDLGNLTITYLTEWQRKMTAGKSIELLDLKLEGTCVEGDPLKLYPICKIVKPPLTIISETMSSFEFKYESDAERVDLILDNFVPIAMEKKSDNMHSITLVVPVGKYKYAFKIGDYTSESYDIEIQKQDVKNTDTGLALTMKWYKSNKVTGGFDEIHGKNSESYIPTLEDKGHYIKGEMICTEVFENHTKPLFTIFDITPPTCVNAKIVGKFFEDQYIKAEVQYFGGTEGKSTYKWFKGDKLLCNGVGYTTVLEDVGSSLRFEYTPVRKEGNIVGETKVLTTPVIQPANPMVSKLEIKGKPIQDGLLEIKYKYFGGYEGKSTFQWEIEGEYDFDPIEGETGRTYRPKLQDIGKKIKCVVTPVGSTGAVGEPDFAVSQPIEPEFPTVKNISLTGELQQYKQLEINYVYYGGVEGKSKIEWFRINRDGEETKIHDVFGNKYMLDLEDVYHTIAVRITPVRSDGTVGKPVTMSTKNTIRPGFPECVSISLDGNFKEAEKLIVTTKYKGGFEGNSIFSWYRSTDNDQFELIKSGPGLKEYICTVHDIYKIIKVTYTPIRNDGIKGEPVSIKTKPISPGDPKISDVAIIAPGGYVENQVLKGTGKYFGGIEKTRIHKWFRINTDDEEFEIHGETSDTYKLSMDDVGCRIVYACQAMRDDLASEWARSSATEVITPEKPNIKSCRIMGEAKEGEKLSLAVEGNHCPENSTIKWVRVIDSKEEEISTNPEYLIVFNDIQHILRVYFTPARKDFPNVKGDTIVLTTQEVISGDPLATQCKLSGDAVEGKELQLITGYFGGSEGNSIYRWYRVEDDKTIPLESNNDKKSYKCTLSDVGCKIMAKYTPVRDDGVKGESETAISDIVQGADPTVSDLKLSGTPLEGQTLTVTGTYYGGKEGKSLLIWCRVNPKDNSEIVVAQDTNEYKCKVEDIGCKLCLKYTPIRSDGKKGEVATVMSSEILPKPPSLKNLKLVGKPYVSNTLGVQYDYDGGVEGKTLITWHFGSFQTGLFTKVSDDAKLLLNVTDLGKFVKAEVTPVRQDGSQGQPASTDAVEIVIDPEMVEKIREAIKPSVTDITVKDDTGQFYTLHFTARHVKLKSSSNKRLVNLKHSDVKFIPQGDNAFLFPTKGKTYKLNFQSSAERDFALLINQIFASLANQNENKDIFGAKFSKGWYKKRGVDLQDLDTAASDPTAVSKLKAAGKLVLLSIFKKK